MSFLLLDLDSFEETSTGVDISEDFLSPPPKPRSRPSEGGMSSRPRPAFDTSVARAARLRPERSLPVVGPAAWRLEVSRRRDRIARMSSASTPALPSRYETRTPSSTSTSHRHGPTSMMGLLHRVVRPPGSLSILRFAVVNQQSHEIAMSFPILSSTDPQRLRDVSRNITCQYVRPPVHPSLPHSMEDDIAAFYSAVPGSGSRVSIPSLSLVRPFDTINSRPQHWKIPLPPRVSDSVIHVSGLSDGRFFGWGFRKFGSSNSGTFAPRSFRSAFGSARNPFGTQHVRFGVPQVKPLSLSKFRSTQFTPDERLDAATNMFLTPILNPIDEPMIRDSKPSDRDLVLMDFGKWIDPNTETSQPSNSNEPSVLTAFPNLQGPILHPFRNDETRVVCRTKRGSRQIADYDLTKETLTCIDVEKRIGGMWTGCGYFKGDDLWFSERLSKGKRSDSLNLWISNSHVMQVVSDTGYVVEDVGFIQQLPYSMIVLGRRQERVGMVDYEFQRKVSTRVTLYDVRRPERALWCQTRRVTTARKGEGRARARLVPCAVGSRVDVFVRKNAYVDDVVLRKDSPKEFRSMWKAWDFESGEVSEEAKWRFPSTVQSPFAFPHPFESDAFERVKCRTIVPRLIGGAGDEESEVGEERGASDELMDCRSTSTSRGDSHSLSLSFSYANTYHSMSTSLVQLDDARSSSSSDSATSSQLGLRSSLLTSASAPMCDRDQLCVLTILNETAISLQLLRNMDEVSRHIIQIAPTPRGKRGDDLTSARGKRGDDLTSARFALTQVGPSHVAFNLGMTVYVVNVINGDVVLRVNSKHTFCAFGPSVLGRVVMAIVEPALELGAAPPRIIFYNALTGDRLGAFQLDSGIAILSIRSLTEEDGRRILFVRMKRTTKDYWDSRPSKSVKEYDCSDLAHLKLVNSWDEDALFSIARQHLLKTLPEEFRPRGNFEYDEPLVDPRGDIVSVAVSGPSRLLSRQSAIAQDALRRRQYWKRVQLECSLREIRPSRSGLILFYTNPEFVVLVSRDSNAGQEVLGLAPFETTVSDLMYDVFWFDSLSVFGVLQKSEDDVEYCDTPTVVRFHDTRSCDAFRRPAAEINLGKDIYVPSADFVRLDSVDQTRPVIFAVPAQVRFRNPRNSPQLFSVQEAIVRFSVRGIENVLLWQDRIKGICTIRSGFDQQSGATERGLGLYNKTIWNEFGMFGYYMLPPDESERQAKSEARDTGVGLEIDAISLQGHDLDLRTSIMGVGEGDDFVDLEELLAPTSLNPEEMRPKRTSSLDRIGQISASENALGKSIVSSMGCFAPLELRSCRLSYLTDDILSSAKVMGDGGWIQAGHLVLPRRLFRILFETVALGRSSLDPHLVRQRLGLPDCGNEGAQIELEMEDLSSPSNKWSGSSQKPGKTHWLTLRNDIIAKLRWGTSTEAQVTEFEELICGDDATIRNLDDVTSLLAHLRFTAEEMAFMDFDCCPRPDHLSSTLSSTVLTLLSFFAANSTPCSLPVLSLQTAHFTDFLRPSSPLPRERYAPQRHQPAVTGSVRSYYVDDSRLAEEQLDMVEFERSNDATLDLLEDHVYVAPIQRRGKRREEEVEEEAEIHLNEFYVSHQRYLFVKRAWDDSEAKIPLVLCCSRVAKASLSPSPSWSVLFNYRTLKRPHAVHVFARFGPLEFHWGEDEIVSVERLRDQDSVPLVELELMTFQSVSHLLGTIEKIARFVSYCNERCRFDPKGKTLHDPHHHNCLTFSLDVITLALHSLDILPYTLRSYLTSILPTCLYANIPEKLLHLDVAGIEIGDFMFDDLFGDVVESVKALQLGMRVEKSKGETSSLVFADTKEVLLFRKLVVSRYVDFPVRFPGEWALIRGFSGLGLGVGEPGREGPTSLTQEEDGEMGRGSVVGAVSEEQLSNWALF